ncbi:type IV secretion system protein VirD4 [Thalassospira sp. MBR-102]|jgi:type IV secretion system protein VirD4|uniref:type IV secretory system conjugative DNA transfer family protein n=1 Tax=unclassified Thalassospira TaxID=2648997 RepID=UPI0007AD7411|nr:MULTISPECIES: type IV secretory system conjugative DNA transfer family protein [unclassified Thalassospira]KZB64649.1 conjugal transfer protein TraG [Thalassospira sp. MCCC 1A02491]MBP3128295.1 conjugal transfer protein TraG [Thalassospira sp. ER-Se-21-Dark]
MTAFYRLTLPVILIAMIAAILWQWQLAVGFDALDLRWWQWSLEAATHSAGLPDEMLYPALWIGITGLLSMFGVLALATRANNSTLKGNRKGDELHGSARWAKLKDLKKARLFRKDGVVVGGWPSWFGRIRELRHDGPEHVLVWAPTRTGKGVSLILPTLLSWRESILCLDIKGENFAKTGGWLASIGHKVLRFEPSASTGSARFNPLAEVRIDTEQDIADCQNIAAMIIDPDGQGMKDYWRQEGYGWLSVVLLHVIYRVRRDEHRTACFDDVNTFLSGITGDGDAEESDDNFEHILAEMASFDHGKSHVNKEVRRGANSMMIKAPQERSGVHSTAKTQLTVFADPIIARNTATSDFRLHDLMNGDAPMALFLVVSPADKDRLRPLLRIILNLFMRRLTERMAFGAGQTLAGYKHRLLLMLDEFTSIGKLEIFEESLAFMAGYGLKAMIIVQNTEQLFKHYGRDESIMANCKIRVAFTPNKLETAKLLSDMTGKATIVQKRRSRSGRMGDLGSVSDNLAETSRPLLTPDECMRLQIIDTEGRKPVPGDALIFVAGLPPILGRQKLYFLDRELSRRSKMTPPQMAFSSTPSASHKGTKS